jgi:hypothetical protein
MPRGTGGSPAPRKFLGEAPVRINAGWGLTPVSKSREPLITRTHNFPRKFASFADRTSLRALVVHLATELSLKNNYLNDRLFSCRKNVLG